MSSTHPWMGAEWDRQLARRLQLPWRPDECQVLKPSLHHSWLRGRRRPNAERGVWNANRLLSRIGAVVSSRNGALSGQE